MRYNHLDMLPEKAFQPVGKRMTLEGGGGGTTTGTTYSTTLPEYAKPYYEELLKQSGKETFKTDAEGVVTGIKDYTPYTGERVAGFTPEQTNIQSEYAGLTTPTGFADAAAGTSYGQNLGYGTAGAGLSKALSYQPTNYNADQVGSQQFGQGAADYYSNPYTQNVTNTALREAMQKGAIDRNALMSGSIGRGTFGGARNALLQAEQNRGLNQQMGDIQYKGASDAYNNAQQQFNADQARAQQAALANQSTNLAANAQNVQGQQYAAGLGKDVGLAGLQAGLDASKTQGALAAAEQTANLERLKAQSTSADEQQAYQQKIDDLKYQQTMEAQDWQKKQLEFYSNILRGNANALGSTQVNYVPQASPISQVAGAGIAGLSAYNLMK
tara:strand:- start:10364 stop:11515 length:1152 start_codon:yes stop_codon:yes gene_type:complete